MTNSKKLSRAKVRPNEDRSAAKTPRQSSQKQAIAQQSAQLKQELASLIFAPLTKRKK